MTLDQLKLWLEGHAFHIEPTRVRESSDQCDWYVWRQTVTGRNCETHGDRLSIVVYPYSGLLNGRIREGVEVELCGQYDSLWWEFRVYSITPNDLVARLPVIEGGLVAAWNGLDGS